MSQHNTPPPDDHVSAYLDGELPAEARARIEQLIANDDRYRQLAQDLRLLRACLQGLPSYQLRNDLSDRILRQAERDSLRPAAPITTSKTSRRWSSGSLAAAAAIVAALMLMVLWPRNPDPANRELARLDKSSRSASSSAPLSAPSPEDEEPFGDSTGQSAKKSSVDSSSSGLVRGGQDGQLRIALSKRALREVDIVASTLSATTEEMSDEGRLESFGRVTTRSPGSAVEPQSEGLALRRLDALEPGEELDDHQFSDDMFSLFDFGTSPSPDLIVLMDVPREAMHQCRLDESLVRQDILLGELKDRPVVEPTESNEGGNAGNHPLDTRVADAPSDAIPLDEVGQARSDVEGDSVAAKNNRQSLPDLVYVSATRAQIDATLRDLRQLPGAFLRVALRVADWDSRQPISPEELNHEEFEADLSNDANPTFRKTHRSEDINRRFVIGRASAEVASSEEHAKPRVRGLAKRLNAGHFRLRNVPDSDRQDVALSKDGVQHEWYFQRIDADEDGCQEANRYRPVASRDDADLMPKGDADPDRMIRVLFLVRAVDR